MQEQKNIRLKNVNDFPIFQDVIIERKDAERFYVYIFDEIRKTKTLMFSFNENSNYGKMLVERFNIDLSAI